MESRDVRVGVDHQRKVVVGGISNKGCKIAAREINSRDIVEVIPLGQETRERIKLKKCWANGRCPGDRKIPGAIRDSSGSMPEGWNAVDKIILARSAMPNK